MSSPQGKRTLCEALNTDVRRFGTSIVSTIAVAVKTTQLYSFEHQHVVTAMKELSRILKSLIQLEKEIELSRVESFLFLNEVRIKMGQGGTKAYDAILSLLQERDVGLISFSDVPSESELKDFVSLLTRPVGDPAEPWKWFAEELKSVGLPSIRFEKYEVDRDKAPEVSDDTRVAAIRLFFRLTQQMQQTIETVKGGRKINFKRLKRSIQAMVDMVLAEESTLLALVNIKDHLGRWANHSVNVAVLAIALGARLGFSKKLLGDLGIAGLTHDVGKLKVRSEAPGDDASYHVYRGVEVLLNQRIVEAVVKSMNVAFLHHFRFDSTGFPRTYAIKSQNFYSRIVAVCDYYDNRTAPPSGGEPRTYPDQVMRFLMEGSSTEFDPLVVKAFVNVMGLYPVGCLVQLDTGELATVVSPSSSPRFLDRPVVRLFADAAGGEVDETVDLMDRDGGSFRRSILKLYQEEEVGLEMDEYLSVI